jgi:hypothetical protein
MTWGRPASPIPRVYLAGQIDVTAIERNGSPAHSLRHAGEFESRLLEPTIEFIRSLSRCKHWFKLLSTE